MNFYEVEKEIHFATEFCDFHLNLQVIVYCIPLGKWFGYGSMCDCYFDW